MDMLLVMPWPSHSHCRLLPSSMIGGCCSQTSALRSAGSNAIFVERLHNAKNADPRSIVAQCVAGHVRRMIASRAADRHVEMEILDIRRHPQCNPPVVGPDNLLALNDGKIIVSRIFHLLAPL